MAARKLAALFAAVLQLCLCQITPEVVPEFLAPLENHTVIQGRDVSFTCVVNHLQSYRVAWIKSDSRAILAIHTRMVTHNPRLSVTHNGHNTWKLHISNVQKNDSGSYMCQVNTDPMRSQMGYMEVVIPPDIMDDESANGLVTQEGGNLRLRCIATGLPKPTVNWKREDGRKIVLREDGKKQVLDTYEGETLELTGILRQEMGTYLCIASSSVPPRVSKRYTVSVHFKPVIRIPNQLVGAPVDSDVVLQCYVEASPQAMNTWYRDSGEKLPTNDKYTMSEEQLSDYSWQMNLTVKSLKKGDFGGYVCSTVNALGNADGCVRLQELQLVDKTTPSILMKNTETRLRKKPIIKEKKKMNGGNNNNRRKVHAMGSYDTDSIGNEDDLGTTQIMAGSTLHEGGKTDRPLTFPSVSPPWIDVNAASSRQGPIIRDIIFLLLLLLRLTSLF
ncbi:lachesin-like isoform X1 [Vespa crabro]|uniref:lachesin-like isoform X1 n=2 Tax=Vespa TaxID=7443 RepID=UPI001F0063A4|nr:lachesin-like isoform X1 [Vespa crabro]XP_046836039.1 lachesin-like isoform X1 [Vespa crabro]XP_046836040.1 lachesin-like isoform X1 [Vespa crabro]XP_046836041.1 lachesin-like isoform X1 [Vespa crabro]XP_046836042.1 lachesin-like isoform X1 [Vespa crabro]XP_046836043.1 lachesin-like isoform X1 [Vespa crabro]XP_046836044.1 lachesin-like isoform X1 [Vespa crabro]XP_046836045.1 lachesin-like isoform X1 [Vespa crabro]XP_046836046.1 lachesin-like isoform X1 [Vespa crabro]